MEPKPSTRLIGRKRHHEDDASDANSVPRKRGRNEPSPEASIRKRHNEEDTGKSGSPSQKRSKVKPILGSNTKGKNKPKTKKKRAAQIQRVKPSLLTLPREVRQQMFFYTFEAAMEKELSLNVYLIALKIILVAPGPPAMPHIAAWATDLASVHPTIHLDLIYVLDRALKLVELMLEELLGSLIGRQVFLWQRWKNMVHNFGFGKNGIDYDAGRTAMRMMIKHALNSDTAQTVLDSTCLKATRMQNARSFLTRGGFGA
ncbi:hypothetical protein BLS_004227 [Venturia inaequalis]|uniref:Uncharacterized protein n=1 Tax=Venturia inaequalis TaxID=5025 RepID=A0A8H3UJQ7_VENIN|nr:hypothetical protein BLS_004227 [Venturia inaequalis]RDI86558.1 hypothetical protein Vi05172_g3359 [Venturia inaequalis]